MSCVAERIIAAGAAPSLWPTVAVGLGSLARPIRELLRALAGATHVTLCVRAQNLEATAGERRSAELVAAACTGWHRCHMCARALHFRWYWLR